MIIDIACTGYNISTQWYEGSSTEHILIVVPGYSSSKARQKSYAQAFIANTNVSVLAIDFSGHGESPLQLRDTRPAQHLLELVAVYDWVRTTYPEALISISGSSYGGFLATHLTQYRKVTNLILRAPAIYHARKFYDPWSMRIDDPNEFVKSVAYRHDRAALAAHPLFQSVQDYNGRVLVVVHGADEIVPVETTDAYIEAFLADSIVAENVPHSVQPANMTSQELADYQSRITDWFMGKTI